MEHLGFDGLFAHVTMEDFETTLKGVGETSSMELLQQIFLGSGGLGSILASPQRDPSGLNLFGLAMGNVLGAMQGVAVRHHFGAVVLLPIVGRLWGCVHHEKGGGLCKLDARMCLIEELIRCPHYEVDYSYPLFDSLRNGKSVGCLWCEKRWPRPKTPTEPHRLLDYVCGACAFRLVDVIVAQARKLAIPSLYSGDESARHGEMQDLILGPGSSMLHELLGEEEGED